MLGEDVEGGPGRDDGVQHSRANPPQQGHAFHQLIPSRGVDPTLGRPTSGVTRPTHPLQEGGKAPGRTHLANQFHGPDVDAQFQGSRGHQGAKLTRAQLRLDAVSAVLGQAAVMRRHRSLSQALGQLVGKALGHAPCVDEDQGRPVIFDVLGNPIEDVPHLRTRGHRLQILTRQLDGQIQIPPMAHVHHLAAGAPVGKAAVRTRPHQQPGQGFDGALGGREADPGWTLETEFIQSRETEGEMRSAFIPGHGMDFIHDHRAHTPQNTPAALGGDEQVERLRGGDQDLGRLLEHRGPSRGRGIAAPQTNPQFGDWVAASARSLSDLLQGLPQVVLDIRRQRLEGRDVHHLDPSSGDQRRTRLLGQRQGAAKERKPRLTPATLGLGSRLVEAIDADQKSRQRLSRTGWRRDQRIVAGSDDRPAMGLRQGRTFGKAALEPFPHRGVKALKFSR